MLVKPIEALFFRDWTDSHVPEILEEIYIIKIYEPFLFGRKDLTIVDVGANIGLASYYFKNFGRVYSLEPAKTHLECFRQMVGFNKIKNITICPYGLSNETKKGKLFHLPNTTAYNLGFFTDIKDFEEVDILTFEDFMIRYKLEYIDLLKLDPEGEEAKIVTSEGFRKYAPKIKVIVGEWHDWCNMAQNQFANVLIDLGYTFRWLPSGDTKLYTAIRL